MGFYSVLRMTINRFARCILNPESLPLRASMMKEVMFECLPAIDEVAGKDTAEHFLNKHSWLFFFALC